MRSQKKSNITPTLPLPKIPKPVQPIEEHTLQEGALFERVPDTPLVPKDTGTEVAQPKSKPVLETPGQKPAPEDSSCLVTMGMIVVIGPRAKVAHNVPGLSPRRLAG